MDPLPTTPPAAPPADPDPTRSFDDSGSTAAAPGPAAGPAAPPGTPGRYVLGDEIARGGMGVVYRARDAVLDREVAVKVLGDRPEPTSVAARRFADEARITGRLQHPAVPPVHDLGTLPDGRPFLAMKLIRGRTLADLLKARPDPAADRGRFVGTFEQICQAVAYAHAHGVVHRDLKPANVMVGDYGEVQVMDWGIAKPVASGGRQPPDASHQGADAPRSPADADGTQAGTVLGTPAYMPPEQARGELDRVGPPSDVFALGGVLCVVLTGRPPFAGRTEEVVRRSAAGDLAEVLARLDGCGAEAELVGLCRRCLAPDPAARPADAGEVAGLVAAYRAGVDERLRAAERERAAAEAKVAEQRRRRRAQAAFAVAVGLLVVGAGAVAWWRHDAARAEGDRLGRNADAVTVLLDRAEAALRAGDAAQAGVALDAADKRATEGGADGSAGRRAALRADLVTLVDLNEADRFQWTPRGGDFPPARVWRERYREAVARFGADPTAVPPAEAADRVARSAVRDRLVAALDVSQSVARRQPLFDLLRAVDPDGFRTAVRRTLLEPDARTRVIALVTREAAAGQPPDFIALLARDEGIPVGLRRDLLADAISRHPDHLGLLMSMGSTYENYQKEGAAERVRWYQAAVSVAPTNPAPRLALGMALWDLGQPARAEAEYRAAVRLDPADVWAHNNLGFALGERGDPVGAEAAYRDALRLDPDLAFARNGLGSLFLDRGDLDRAEAEFRAVLARDPTFARARYNLGLVRRRRGDLAGAEAEFREAVRLSPREMRYVIVLGQVQAARGDLAGAEATFRQAVRLDPKHPPAHNLLGNVLDDRGDPAGAEAEFREAIRIDPTFDFAFNNLGRVLSDRGDLPGAIAAFREAVRLNPDNRTAHRNLASTLAEAGDPAGAEAAYRALVGRRPDDAEAYHDLGLVLKARGEYDAASAELRTALCLEPGRARFHNSLGAVLMEQAAWAEAAALFEAAVRLEPDYAFAHNNLAVAREAVGDFAGAAAAYREAARLDPKDADLRRRLARADRRRELAPRLADVLAGRAEPAGPAEACDLARMCGLPFQGRFANAVRLYERAFAAAPDLAADPDADHRYNAACFAVRAGRGDGPGAPADPAARAALRARALGWLRADLAAWTERAGSAAAGDRKEAAETLAHWLEDADLAGVRPGLARIALPADERARWDALWADVKAARARAR